MALRLSRTLRGRIAGLGSAFPERLPDGASAELDNEAVIRLTSPVGRRGPRGEAEVAEVAAALSETLGVRRRRWAHRVGDPFVPGELTSLELQREALAAALVDAGLPATALGAILTATSTPAKASGATGPALAAALGARGAAYDLRAGCAGGLFALVHAFLLADQSGQPVAAAAGDTFSKLVPPGHTVGSLAFGDGAGAAVVVPDAGGPALLGASLEADGTLGHLGTSPSPFPPSHEAIDAGAYFLTASPEELAQRAPGLYAAAIADALAAAGLGIDAVDLLVPHQPGRGLLQAVAAAVGLPPEKLWTATEAHANIGAGGILVALSEARTAGRLPRGATILLAALGGGLCWGAAVLRL